MRSATRGLLTAGCLALLLASCGVAEQRGPVRPGAGGGAGMSDFPVRVGKPYQIRGVTYVPADTPDYDALGHASWYGEELKGNRTANGERFNPSGVSAAHRTLPLPSYVEVTALSTGRTILVRVNDRGPFSGNRLIDLSRGAAEQLGVMGHGDAPVRVRRVEPPERERAMLRAGGRAPERPAAPPSLLAGLRDRLGRSTGAGAY